MNGKKVAIVTGGTRGMGRNISLALAEAGNIVVAVYRSNEESAIETLNLLREISSDSEVVKGDVSKSDDVKRIVSYVAEKYKRIDILVNNAGIFDFMYHLLYMKGRFWD